MKKSSFFHIKTIGWIYEKRTSILGYSFLFFLLILPWVSTKTLVFNGSIYIPIVFMCTLLFLLFITEPIRSIKMTRTDLLLFLFIGYTLFISFISDNRLITWKYPSLWILVLLTYLFVRTTSNKFQRTIFVSIAFSGFLQSILSWIQYFEWTTSNHILFDVTGSFLNPAPLGGYIGLALLIMIEYARESVLHKKYVKTFCLLFPILSITGISILSFSRAAWFSVLIVFSWQALRSRVMSTILFIVFITFCASGMYLLKKKSADGRLFIWKVSTTMWLESPLFGNGAGSFSAQYMYAQADYFENNPESDYILKASNNYFAFNEYIRIGCEYGLIGLLLLFTVLIHNWRGENSTSNGSLRQSILLYIACFSFFSYTIEVIPIVVLLVTGLALKQEKPVRTFSIPHPFSLICGIMFSIILCGVSCFSLYIHKKSEEVYSLIHDYEHIKSTEIATAIYERYYDNTYNPDYILGFSRLLYNNQEYEKAYKLLKQASVLTPSSEVLCDFGNCCFYLGKYDEAEYYLHKACYMTPSHILPFYYLFRFYVESDQKDKAKETGNYILHRDFKREGSVALQVKGIIKGYLLKENH